MKQYREPAAFLLLLFLGLGLRLAVVTRYPTIPVSDFRNLISFAQQLRDGGLLGRQTPWFWEGFNIGLPLILCGLFKMFPRLDPVDIARVATAAVNGLLPLLPFFLWRGVLSFRLRVLAGAALAIWPGQVLFAGVVAQDNWIVFPAVALGALAVRALADGERAWPVSAGLLFVAGVAVRADMLLMLLPLWLAAIRVDLLRVRYRQVIAGSLAAGLGLLGLAAYRYAGSRRFSLTPEFVGITTLGAFLPGSSVSGWEPPYAFLASVRPDLLRDRKAMLAQTPPMAVREALRRPGFHTLRVIAQLGSVAIESEAGNLYWSLRAADVLPAAARARGEALASRFYQPLRYEMVLLQALFLAALIVGLRRRSMSVLILALAVVLKCVLHAFGVIQARYFVVVTGLEILTITVAVEEVLNTAAPARVWQFAQALTVGAIFGWSLWVFSPRLVDFVQRHDIDPPQQRTYRFFLGYPSRIPAPGQGADLVCTVNQGSLVEYWPWSSATIRTLQRDPAPGDQAVAVCQLTGAGKPRPAMLQVLDSYAPGGSGGRMVQRVAIDGAEVFSHDVAQEPWSGWMRIPLGLVGKGTKKSLVIEVKAVRPDSGMAWGDYARTTFQLAEGSPDSNLALGKPAAQSSTLADYATTGAAAAVDGNTDGKFFNGSVTHTNLDPHPWWQVDLLASVPLQSIAIWNRTDCCGDRLRDYWVFVSDTPFGPTDTPATLRGRGGTWSSHQVDAPLPFTRIPAAGARGRYVRVQLNGAGFLSLAEVQVSGQ